MTKAKRFLHKLSLRSAGYQQRNHQTTIITTPVLTNIEQEIEVKRGSNQIWTVCLSDCLSDCLSVCLLASKQEKQVNTPGI